MNLSAKDKAKLLVRYSKKIKPLLPLATKAFGARDAQSPEHTASRKYTELLVEYTEAGGSLPALARELNVAYAGMRRRVVQSVVPVGPRHYSHETDARAYKAAIKRIKDARKNGVEAYHEQLFTEYEVNDLSLDKIAKAMGIASAQPYYFAVNNVRIRLQNEAKKAAAEKEAREQAVLFAKRSEAARKGAVTRAASRALVSA